MRGLDSRDALRGIDLGTCELVVREIGVGSAGALGLHGLSGSGAFWIPLAEELSDLFSFVSPDLLGFGASPKPPIEYSVDAHLGAIQHLVERRNDWTLFGHSMGATLAVHLALRQPERVRQLVLFSAPVFASAERRRHLLGRQNLLTRLCLRYPPIDRFIAYGFYAMGPVVRSVGPRIRKDLPPQVVIDYTRHTRQSYKSSAHSLLIDKDLVPDLARVQQPVLVIQGEHDSMVDNPADVAWPPNVHLEIVPSAGHLWPVTHAPEAAALIRRFLSS